MVFSPSSSSSRSFDLLAALSSVQLYPSAGSIASRQNSIQLLDADSHPAFDAVNAAIAPSSF